MKMQQPKVILMAEDDDDDFLLATDALREARFVNALMRVRDGQELLDYLRRKAPYHDNEKYPMPAVVLLDLNMPRVDGRTALREIKADQNLRHVPIIVLTTSHAEEDIVRSYEFGVNSFIIKPVTFPALVDAIRILGRYWFELVELSPKTEAPNARTQAATAVR